MKTSLPSSWSRIFLAFAALMVSYHLIFRQYLPLPNGMMGHDYVLTLGGFLDGYLWFRNNGLFAAPWFTPSFCGGQALFAEPQSAYYSVPQLLTFLVDPVQAVYLAFLLFAAIGFWGAYVFARRCLDLGQPAALAVATVFLFNGFYVHRMIIGHYGYQSFMLLPLVAYLLLRSPETPVFSKQGLSDAVPAGVLIAYWFHSGLTTLIPPAALSVLGLACIAALYTRRMGLFHSLVARGALATLISTGLCISKLSANVALMSHFGRDYYPLPGIDDIPGLLSFLFQSLFYSSEHVYQTVTPLWKNMRWPAFPHELAYSVTPLPLLILLTGAASAVLKRGESAPLRPAVSPAVYSILGAILAVPALLVYYSPEWNAVLKRLPLIGSTTSPYRWIVIYIPLLAVATGIALQHAGKLRPWLTGLLLLGVPALNALENRDYYEQQSFNPASYVAFYNAVKNGEIVPRIAYTADLRTPNSDLIIDNGLFMRGGSPMHCYNPVYGYRLEKLVTAPLTTGPVTEEHADGTLNLHNPACLVFPEENRCSAWDAFKRDDKAALEQFAAYRPFHFERSAHQSVADLITSMTLLLVALYGVTAAWLFIRGKYRIISRNR